MGASVVQKKKRFFPCTCLVSVSEFVSHKMTSTGLFPSLVRLSKSCFSWGGGDFIKPITFRGWSGKTGCWMICLVLGRFWPACSVPTRSESHGSVRIQLVQSRNEKQSRTNNPQPTSSPHRNHNSLSQVETIC